MKLREILSWVIVGALVVLLVWLLNTESGEPVVIKKHTTDTLVIEKIDTHYITQVKMVVKEKVDTHYIHVRDSIYFPIFLNEYQFKEEGVFDFKVKGHDVSFISAEVYPKTVTQIVETTTNTTIKENKSALFIYGGFSSICENFSPKMGLALSLKNKWLISADIGYFQKQPIWGCTVGYNMLNK